MNEPENHVIMEVRIPKGYIQVTEGPIRKGDKELHAYWEDPCISIAEDVKQSQLPIIRKA